MRTAAARVGNEIGSVGADVNEAVEVGAVDLRATGSEPSYGLWRRVAVGIAPTCADDGDARPHLLDECVGRGRAAAVVRDLEHVQRSLVAGDALGQQLWIDLLLDVAGKDDASRSKVEIQHN
jgi:hypothetical protein